jgi:hypothetical protein
MRHWILQANPDIYKVDDAVAKLSEEWWRTGAQKIQIKDRFCLIRSGENRAIIAFGIVVRGPETILPQATGFELSNFANKVEPRVGVRYFRRAKTQTPKKVNFFIFERDC